MFPNIFCIDNILFKILLDLIIKNIFMLYFKNVLIFFNIFEIRLDPEQTSRFLLNWARRIICNIPAKLSFYVTTFFFNMNCNGFFTLILIFNHSLLHCWLNSPPLLTAFLVIFIHLKYVCWCHILLFKGNLFKAKSKIIVT